MKKIALLIPLLLLTGCSHSQMENVKPAITAEYTTTAHTDSVSETNESTEAEEPEDKWLMDTTVQKKKDAQDLMDKTFGTPYDDISLVYESSSSNGAEVWYDFSECYQSVPIYGLPFRLHAMPDNMVLIQGDVTEGPFEECNVFLDYERVLELYCQKNDIEEGTYKYQKLCYLYLPSRDELPLCYYYASPFSDLFLSAVTGVEISEQSTVVF